MNPEGTLYVGCGSSSGSLYQKAEPNDNLVCQIEQEQPMAIRFDVTDRELRLKAYTVDDWTVRDEYTIRKE